MGYNYLALFRHIEANQLLYKSYFRLGYDSRHIIDLSAINSDSGFFPPDHMEYHLEFHKTGLNAVIKKWLNSGCGEPPEAIVKIIEDEYRFRTSEIIE